MSSKRNVPSIKWAAITLVVVAIVVAASATALSLWPVKEVNNFEECIAAGGTRMESYPEQCMYKRKTYVNEAQRLPQEPVGNDSGEYIGLLEDDALGLAKKSNTPARVVERDGEGLPTTMDFVYGRHNLYVKDGKVYKVEIEGQATDSN